MKPVVLAIAALVVVVLYGCTKKFPVDSVEACPKMVRANGVDICTESFGNPVDPPILLIMGATASMLSWEDDFCRRLASGRRYVIRYDNRDTGRSVTYPPGSAPYTLEDQAKDAIGVLDAYGIDRAHIAGASMGGMVAQLLGIERPGRVLTLTLIMSSPHGPEDPDLPPMSEKILAHFQSGGTLDWSDQTAVIDFRVGTMRVLGGSKRTFDEKRARDLVTREVRRARNPASMNNHALMASKRWRERLGEIKAPTLVIHGTDDPVLPYGHGMALSGEICSAKLLPLDGAGHELHPDDWDTIIKAVLQHSAFSPSPAPGQ